MLYVLNYNIFTNVTVPDPPDVEKAGTGGEKGDDICISLHNVFMISYQP